MRIKTQNIEERAMLLSIAFGCGCTWHGSTTGEPTTPAESEKRYSRSQYPSLKVDFGRKYISGGASYNYEDDNTVAEFLREAANFYLGELKKVQINDKHSAILTPTGIKVGCQEISKEKLQEVNKMVFGKEA